MSDQFRQEQKDYYLSTSQWTDTHPQQMLGPPACFKRYDLHTLTLDELKARAAGRGRMQETGGKGRQDAKEGEEGRKGVDGRGRLWASPWDTCGRGSGRGACLLAAGMGSSRTELCCTAFDSHAVADGLAWPLLCH